MFDGALTFAKTARLHELAFDVPLERILLASAAPRNLPTQARRAPHGIGTARPPMASL